MLKTYSCYFEPYLALIFISSILFSLFFIYSILQSNNMIQKSCTKIPNVIISDDAAYLIGIIAKGIENAHKKVLLSFSEINLTILSQSLIPAIRKAHSNGAEITMLTSFTNISDFKIILENNKYINFFDIATASKQISSQSIIADNKAFIATFLISDTLNNESIANQLVMIDECDVMSKDLSSFVEYYQFSQSKSDSSVLSGKYIAQTSANRPISVQLQNNEMNTANSKKRLDKDAKVSRAFMFHNPQSFLVPIRIDTIQVLSALFDEDPSSIDIFTYSPQCLSFIENLNSDQFSLYFALKSLLIRGKTKIRYLASKKSYQEKKISCFASFLSFDNAELRLYDKKFLGPNYIIAHFDNSNDESFIFSQPISDFQFQNILSLHLATDDAKTSYYLSSNFNSVWDISTPMVLNITL